MDFIIFFSVDFTTIHVLYISYYWRCCAGITATWAIDKFCHVAYNLAATVDVIYYVHVSAKAVHKEYTIRTKRRR